MSHNIPKTKSLYAYEAIKDAILLGEYQPDERLVLKDLSKSLSLSAIPLRESLNNLEKDGLVIQTPHQGFRVAPLSVNEFEELLAIRLSLELTALPHTIRNITDEQILHLASLTEEMFSYWEKYKNSPATLNIKKEFMTMNKELHIGMASASKLIHLPGMLARIFDLSHRYMNIMEHIVGIGEVDVREHVEMVNLIKEKNEEKLKKLLESHYERVITEFKKTSAKFFKNEIATH
jgi:DNA-binding GntR family transcriptional regulator